MRYLTETEVIAIYYLIIDHYSPAEPKGILQAELLNASVERPKQTLLGEDAYPDIYSKAAALFESIIKNQCFLNANKQTAFVHLLQFLSYNGYRFVMDSKDAEDFVVDVVLHQYQFDEIIQVLQKHCMKMIY